MSESKAAFYNGMIGFAIINFKGATQPWWSKYTRTLGQIADYARP